MLGASSKVFVSAEVTDDTIGCYIIPIRRTEVTLNKVPNQRNSRKDSHKQKEEKYNKEIASGLWNSMPLPPKTSQKQCYCMSYLSR